MVNYKTYRQNSAFWPKSFRNMHDPPKQLHVIGEMPREDAIKIAIVGSRRPTAYGEQVTTQLASRLGRSGAVIISGLALGVDGLAHEGAVNAEGKTVAVLPCGIDRIYPRRHQRLSKQIIKFGGALVSEYPPGVEATNYSFPARNRLIAALADMVVVVEAGEQSGSLITANLALDQGVPIFAVPGPITSTVSRGTNQLISDGAAPLVSIEDFASYLNLSDHRRQHRLSSTEQRIVDIVRREPMSSDQLGNVLGLDGAKLQQIITELELNELITERAGRLHASQIM